jgi:CDP-diacylglycerol--glycerol-3-phosphate 3-phosphatidyltransferase
MANIITVARFPLLFLIAILLTLPSAGARAACVPLVLVLILMDSIDGLVARSRKEESLLGSVLDIMADRSVELVLWVVYAHLRLVPLAIPIIFIVRGTVVDSLRAIGVGAGKTPFGSTTSRLGRFLVGSPWMRSSYGIAKALAFTLLALTATLQLYAASGAVLAQTAQTTHTVALVLSWIATAFCIVRGLPVIIESFARLAQKNAD